MKKIGIVLSAFVGTAFLVTPLMTFAKPLTLVNTTTKSFTIRLNNICSSEFGVMKVNSSKTVTEEILNKSCGQNASNCEAKIFKSNDCTGEQIADFNFDTNNGLKDTFHSAKHYSLTLSYPFNAVSLTEAL